MWFAVSSKPYVKLSQTAASCGFKIHNSAKTMHVKTFFSLSGLECHMSWFVHYIVSRFINEYWCQFGRLKSLSLFWVSCLMICIQTASPKITIHLYSEFALHKQFPLSLICEQQIQWVISLCLFIVLFPSALRPLPSCGVFDVWETAANSNSKGEEKWTVSDQPTV